MWDATSQRGEKMRKSARGALGSRGFVVRTQERGIDVLDEN